MIIFTGLFSRAFLRRRLGPLRWLGIGFVIVGLATVGICDMVYGKHGGGGKNVTADAGWFLSDRPLFHEEYLGGSIRGGNPDAPESGYVVDGQFRMASSEANRSSSDIVLGDVLIVCAQVRMIAPCGGLTLQVC